MRKRPGHSEDPIESARHVLDQIIATHDPASIAQEVQMPRNRRLLEAHFICRQGRRVKYHSNGTFTTGEWVMNPAHIWQELVFALHETKAQSSYLQGVVVRVTNIRRDRKSSGRVLRRVELLVRRTPASLPWRGRGSGEKGFVWS
jgi:hypothetical protein